jgi:hypothetical protein
MIRRRWLLRTLVVVVSALACVVVMLPLRAATRRARVVPRTIDDAVGYWARERFVEMVSPVRLPSRDGREAIRIFLKVPDDATLGVVSVDGQPRLQYPVGTVAERVDGSGTSVSDVRGTRFAANGQEFFHVLEPVDPGATSRLVGYEWQRDDPAAQADATDQMTTLLRSSPRVRQQREIARFERLNDCAGCHRHDRAQLDHLQPGTPNRPTDDGGLFAIQTVLTDEAPVERHRARDMNAGDRFVHVTCGTAPARLVTAGPRVYFDCDDGPVPVARVDLGAALGAGDPHARAVCASRRYLFDHLAPSERAAFAHAFAECEIRSPGTAIKVAAATR